MTRRAILAMLLFVCADGVAMAQSGYAIYMTVNKRVDSQTWGSITYVADVKIINDDPSGTVFQISSDEDGQDPWLNEYYPGMPGQYTLNIRVQLGPYPKRDVGYSVINYFWARDSYHRPQRIRTVTWVPPLQW